MLVAARPGSLFPTTRTSLRCVENHRSSSRTLVHGDHRPFDRDASSSKKLLWLDRQSVDRNNWHLAIRILRASLLDRRYRSSISGSVTYLLERFQDISSLGTINHVNLARH